MNYIVLHPGHQPEVIEAEKIGLADLQHHVGGLITSAYVHELEELGITVFANDEGLLQRLQPNIAWMVQAYNGPQPMVLVGGLVFCAHDDEGETIGLTDGQIGAVKEFIEKVRPNTGAVLMRAMLGI